MCVKSQLEKTVTDLVLDMLQTTHREGKNKSGQRELFPCLVVRLQVQSAMKMTN